MTENTLGKAISACQLTTESLSDMNEKSLKVLQPVDCFTFLIGVI